MLQMQFASLFIPKTSITVQLITVGSHLSLYILISQCLELKIVTLFLLVNLMHGYMLTMLFTKLILWMETLGIIVGRCLWLMVESFIPNKRKYTLVWFSCFCIFACTVDEEAKELMFTNKYEQILDLCGDCEACYDWLCSDFRLNEYEHLTEAA